MNFGDPFAPVYVIPCVGAVGLLVYFILSGAGQKDTRRRPPINYFPERED